MPILVLCLVSSLLLAACNQSRPAMPPRVVEVGVIRVQATAVPLTTELSGRTTAAMTSDVRPQVAGIVRARLFDEGSQVKAGQVLYQIEPASYQATLAQAQAALKNAEAAVDAARLKSERYADLLSIQGVSRQDADDAKAAWEEAVANVAEKKAAVNSARIDVEHTQVRAPISGRIGKSSVTPGALVTASQTDAMATIRTLDPMYVDVTQSSVDLLRMRKLLSSGGAMPGSAHVSLLLEDGSIYGHDGALKFAEVSVDEATGSVTLRAQFPNPQGLLLPGMYVRAVLDQAVDPKGILVPQQGIMRDPNGDATAMVVGEGDKLEQRAVTTQRAIGDQWLIASGLKTGDRLVVEGLGKVKAGDTVKVVAAGSAPDAGAPLTAVPAHGAALAASGAR